MEGRGELDELDALGALASLAGYACRAAQLTLKSYLSFKTQSRPIKSGLTHKSDPRSCETCQGYPYWFDGRYRDQPAEATPSSPGPGASLKEEEPEEEEGEEPPRTGEAAVGRKPTARTSQKLELAAPQKWVQCAKCELWRKVRPSLQGRSCIPSIPEQSQPMNCRSGA